MKKNLVHSMLWSLWSINYTINFYFLYIVFLCPLHEHFINIFIPSSKITAVSSFWSKSDKPTLWRIRKWIIFLLAFQKSDQQKAKTLFIGTHQPSQWTVQCSWWDQNTIITALHFIVLKKEKEKKRKDLWSVSAIHTNKLFCHACCMSMTHH